MEGGLHGESVEHGVSMDSYLWERHKTLNQTNPSHLGIVLQINRHVENVFVVFRNMS